MKIGVDCDGVIEEFMSQWLRFNQEKYGNEIKYEEVYTLNFAKLYDIPVEETNSRIEEFFYSSYFDEIEPVIHSKEASDRLSTNNELYVVTSRPLSLTNSPFIVQNKTKKNIEKNFPGTFLDIFHTDQYEDLTKTGWDKLGGQTRKAGICNALEIKVLIEDSYDNAISCSNSEIYVYLLNRPWNQANHLPPNVKRVNDWIEIERSLN